jgi:hypothetical protein
LWKWAIDQVRYLPDLNFGHLWWEYFDIEVWRDVVEVFLNNGKGRL